MEQSLFRRISRKSRLLRSAVMSISAFSLSPIVVSGKHHLAAFGSRILARNPCLAQRLFTLSQGDIGDTISASKWQDVLPYEKGAHRAAKIVIPVIKSGEDPFDKTTFKERLENTISSCKEIGLSSLWIQIPMSRGRLLEDMVDAGLQFHHAEGEIANLLLWLGEGESKVPTYATHQIGVGAVVVNSSDEILCVRELRNNYMPWKIPGGLSELGEQLDEAVVREVMEETGVPCRFKSILCFRHTHGLQFGRSDICFVCQLEPIEEVGCDGKIIIPAPIPQEGEIECTAWVPMIEYRDMVCGENGHPMMKHVMRIYDQGEGIKTTVVDSIVPGRRANPMYHAFYVAKKDESS